MTELDTPFGPARVDISVPAGPSWALLALGHGAGGGVEAPDLTAVHDAAVAAGVTVARITQPYRVAGRRAPAPAAQLDTAWLTVVRALTGSRGESVPLFVGGRSSGARVACRTAVALGARAVVCLAFPVHPPGRSERSRLPELETGLPTLCVSGERDPFGVPPVAPGREVHIVAGAVHSLRRDLRTTGATVVEWMRRSSGG